ncbi:MAG: 16S rRNA (cytosine(967)-C(5))-methyltransferase RsmB [Acidobacteriota bacterium]|jgi:16S rRNA (cytosine967-C5)-methyltransferase
MPLRGLGVGGRGEAFRILLRVETGGAYASALLRRLPEALEPRERALAHELVLGTLRWQGWLEATLAPLASRPPERLDPPVRIALRLGAYQILRMDRIPAAAAVDESVRLARRAVGPGGAGYVNGVLRALCRARSAGPSIPAGSVEGLAVRTSHPGWLVARRVRELGEAGAARALAANNEPAPLTLRANPARGGVRALRERLEALGHETQPGRWSRRAVRMTAGAPPPALFREGWFAVQDEASQLVTDLVAAAPGHRVLDVCAAPGGKATDVALGAGRPLVVAADLHPGRLRRVREERDRLGVPRMLLAVQDATRPSLAPGTFDRVLVDAPCSGTGTLRRHPEIRWRLREEGIAALGALQTRILRAAVELVRPGGRIIFSVCSLEPEEGPEPVRVLLDSDSRLCPVHPRDLAAGIPEPLIASTGPCPHLSTRPERDDVDGFFAAVLCRER